VYQFYDVSDNTMTKKYLPFFNQKIKLKMEDRKWKIQGFTLIELLIVISIIGILAAMVTISFMNTQRQARDTQRKSDLSQYRNALEAFASKNNGLFPGESALVSVDNTTVLIWAWLHHVSPILRTPPHMIISINLMEPW